MQARQRDGMGGAREADAAYERAIDAWQQAEEQAQGAERVAARHREAARVARAHAAERRGRAADACAARQVAFARGLVDAAAAHERSAEGSDHLAEEAERRARPLRAEAEVRLRELGRLMRAARAAERGGGGAAPRRGAA
jgi:hypothetical protein